MVQKVSPNENYIVRQLNTNNFEILHRSRNKNVVPNQSLHEIYREERLPADEENIFPQHDFYKITWEPIFGDQLETRVNELFPTNLPNGEQPVTSSD